MSEQQTTRWKEHTCLRCRNVLTEGQGTNQLKSARYNPMSDGPEWVAVGDWDHAITLGVVLCDGCLDAVVDYAMKAPADGTRA